MLVLELGWRLVLLGCGIVWWGYVELFLFYVVDLVFEVVWRFVVNVFCLLVFLDCWFLDVLFSLVDCVDLEWVVVVVEFESFVLCIGIIYCVGWRGFFLVLGFLVGMFLGVVVSGMFVVFFVIYGFFCGSGICWVVFIVLVGLRWCWWVLFLVGVLIWLYWVVVVWFLVIGKCLWVVLFDVLC